jgi:predicted amidohydrolase YtcJ
MKQFHARLEEGWREPYAYISSASALKGGPRPTLHSDWNVIEIGPLRMVENAVTRTMHHGGDVLNPAEKAPVEAALRRVAADATRLHTKNRAASVSMETEAALAIEAALVSRGSP